MKNTKKPDKLGRERERERERSKWRKFFISAMKWVSYYWYQKLKRRKTCVKHKMSKKI